MQLFTEFFASVPWFLPGMLVWAPAALLLTPTVADALRSNRLVVFAMLISFGGVVLATLTPTSVALSVGAPQAEWCDLDRMALPPLSELLAVHDTLRNVLLFIPLGLTLGLLGRTRRAGAMVIAAYALPFVIETLQLALPGMGRGCQSADLIDNAIGLTLGLVAGGTLRIAADQISRQGRGTTASP